MTKEETEEYTKEMTYEEYTKEMTYSDAVSNVLHGKCIPYRKATLTKLNELLDKLEQEPCKEYCDDAISRQKAIDAIDVLYLDGDSLASHLANAEGDTLIGKYQAITALDDLPSVNPKSCEDAISRQDAIKKVSEILKGVFVEYEDIAQKAIGSLPPVTPQPKTGHWEWTQYDSNPNVGNWHCSECRCIVVIGCGYKKSKCDIPLHKYCPQCGCRIVELQESEGQNERSNT